VPKHLRPTILFVGRIATAKGAEVLVRAALALADDHPGLRVRMLGRDEEGLGDRLLATARAAGFPDLLELAGPASRASLPAELSRATLFAAPSFYEGGPGLVYLEAMACGLPVVGCEGSGASEVITPEDDGLLVPPGDVEALVKALDRLLRDPALRAAMGARARARVLAEADSRARVRRLESLYAAIIEGRV
jgi:glycosyltransferase involved in cell wall biosynthesis